MPTLEQVVARRIRVRGLVQGIGFRPAVHRLATSLNLRGWVCNDADGLSIHIEGADAEVDLFAGLLKSHAPPISCIEAITDEAATCSGFKEFEIREGPALGGSSLEAQVPADRALCADCRAETLDSANRRYRHPFASCIQCGPRYSIVSAMPYEREGTTMRRFRMCLACRMEYESPNDRRFRAEPIACSHCGPRLGFVDAAGPIVGDWPCIVAAAAALRSGRILALKGLGGYQLLVRADDDMAVMRLRERKRRPSKPFAVMVPSLAEAERLAAFSPMERQILQDPANPIVLVESRNAIAAVVAPGLRHIGLFLPTTPLHLLLLSQLDFPVVATSGNRSEEPIAIDDCGRDSLTTIADRFLDHDRPIARRVDDSVVRVIDDRVRVIRSARGFAPCNLPALQRWAAKAEHSIPPVLAVGGQQKVALALWTGSQAVLAQHLGDMDLPEARHALEQATDDLCNLYRCEPKIWAGDLHPEYYTTCWAESAHLPFIKIQHHHAHAVACMVEHDLLDRGVLGITFDGTGFGPDRTIWGGEILDASIGDFRRIASLDLFSLPGGEAAIHEPNRVALSLLGATFGDKDIPGWLLDRLHFTKQRASSLLRIIDRRIRSPLTSSVGRLFDGVAALLLMAHQVTYEGEAALLLEDATDPTVEAAYSIKPWIDEGGVRRGDWRPMIRCLTDDVENGVPVAVCAAKFHNALAHFAANIASISDHEDIVLGGACFQNAFLMLRTRMLLERLGKRVHAPSRIPANDGGLSVGQLAVAMAHWNQQQRNPTHVPRHPRPNC
jgi:hydrogenase maturation protein HypF